MISRVAALSIVMAFAAGAIASADANPTYTGPMSATEKTFVASIQADFMHRFPKASDAVKAGYVRYTNADDTGAISYANFRWSSSNIRHPSQLWYDKNGNLLGADFSELNTDGKRPNVFGVNPGRWYEFGDHVHG